MSKVEVAVVMGSDSDLPVARKVVETLERFGVGWEISVMSAHRSPRKTLAFAAGAAASGLGVIIAIAGGAAALAGVISSETDLPVIAVPVATNLAGGLDSLLSVVQMPSGVPVLSTGTNSGGAVNAAVAAVRILALGDEGLAGKLAEYRAELAMGVDKKDASVKAELGRKDA
ncbi:MAG: 5-(carboxyamino)imidazole ribonucleotide mutase [Planctomycetes bacterium]|nr:5-(carboxyamino)imidazole ribonucleotide mutase [Planctomycetota bacterium]